MDVYTLCRFISWRIYRVNVRTLAKRNLVKGCKRITFVKHTNCIIQDGDNTWWLTNDRPYLPGNLRGQKNTPHVTTFIRYFPWVTLPVTDICVCNIYNVVEFKILRKLFRNLRTTTARCQLFVSQSTEN